MKRVDSMKAITTAYEKLTYAEDMNDLKRMHLTLADYHSALDVMQELRKPGSTAKTFITAVADFFERCGYEVKLTGINYRISC